MPSKERSTKGRKSEPVRQVPKNEKDENGIERMEADAYRMMSVRVVFKQRPIHHVRNPGERMPVRRRAGRQRPPNSSPR